MIVLCQPIDEVFWIPCEKFVSPLTREYHLYMLPGQLRDEVDAQIRRFADWFVTMPSKKRPILSQVRAFHNQFVMLGTKVLCNKTSIR